MTTLDKLTPEQRAQCVGRWADAHGQTWVIFKVYGETCTLIDPDYGFSSMLNKNVTPRPDLPRAWTPQGQPVPMRTEYGGDEWDPDLEEPFHWPLDDSNTCCQDIERTHRRFVTKWEELP